ncbi:hypothetical protein ABG768_005223, partial [Culter alburnus]
MANLIASLRRPKNSQLEHQNSNGNLLSLFCMFLSLAAPPLCPHTSLHLTGSHGRLTDPDIFRGGT